MLTKLPHYCAAKRLHKDNSTHMKVNYVFFTSYAKTNKNQLFHYTRCITPKRATILRGSSPRQCARATQILSQQWLAVGSTVFDLTGPRFEPQTSRSRDERVTARPNELQINKLLRNG